MRLLTTVLCTTVLAGATLSAQMPARPASPPGSAEIEVGGKWETEKAPNGRERQVYKGGKWVTLSYGRPLKRGRELFGTGDAYATKLNAGAPVWRAGADVSTRLKTEAPLVIGGKTLAPGEYTMFVDLKPGNWTLIVSTHKAQEKYDPNNKEAIWGAYGYDAKNDVARVTAKPVALTNGVETLSITFNDLRDESATLNVAWEKVRVPVTISVDVKSVLVPQIEATMASGGEKLPYFNAAMYYFENNIDLNKALAWMDAGIAANPAAFYMVYRKALIQEKMGDKAGAIATAKLSIEGANKADGAVKEEYIALNEALIARLK